MAHVSTESPLDDLTFDLVTILQKKARALQAYEEYLRDADEDEEVHELLTRLRRQDEEDVRALKEVLARRLDEELGFIEEEYEEDEYDEDEELGADAAEGEDGISTSSADDQSPPRRGESTQRRL